ncbi:MAG: alpha/beta hydrolase [Acidobacteriota bacterium]
MSRSLSPPSLLLSALEGRALYELAATAIAYPWLRKAPRGDGSPVLAFPGFLATDFSTRPLRAFLKDLGYYVHGWKLGRNLGPKGDLEERMQARLAEVYGKHQRKVALVGWSLGGLYAREIARSRPELVRCVITLGSPFASTPRASRPWRLFSLTSGMKAEDLEHRHLDEMANPPPVPTTAIYTRTDGVTNWRGCVQPDGPLSESIEVESSHCGLGFHPVGLYAVADRLAQDPENWQRFERTGIKRLLFPEPLHLKDGNSRLPENLPQAAESLPQSVTPAAAEPIPEPPS